jgi:hypothetical protein
MANFNSKQKLVIGSILLLFVIVVGVVTFYDQFYQENLNKSLADGYRGSG